MFIYSEILTFLMICNSNYYLLIYFSLLTHKLCTPFFILQWNCKYFHWLKHSWKSYVVLYVFFFRTQLEDGQLCTSAMCVLEKTQNQLHLLHKYKKCIIRIHFPNRLVLQTIFKSTETILDIIDFVRKYLVDESLDFCLCKSCQ